MTAGAEPAPAVACHEESAVLSFEQTGFGEEGRPGKPEVVERQNLFEFLSGEFAVTVLTTDVVGNTATLCFNGSDSGTSVAFDTESPAPLALGGSSGSGTTGYDGEMGEMIVYDRVLTAGEINEIGFYLAQRYNIAYVPEPASALVLVVGFAAAGLRRRRR